ncbi:MAG: superoxide dismutase [Bacteroidales bacterium]|nr:superoxide dismutase [Bacteroidales bacterium]
MFRLINIPYPIDALEPVISARTLEFHYGKHLQGYVDNLNKLIAGTAFESMSLEDIVRQSEGAVFNNAGQILNHNLYFTQFRPSTVISSVGEAEVEKSIIIKQIINQWGSLDTFKNEFVSKGTTLFGSGWVWLQADASGTLSIAQYSGADNPVAHGLRPLLTFDVWEHAYYLDYQNRRAAHLEALWEIVDWGVVEERLSR